MKNLILGIVLTFATVQAQQSETEKSNWYDGISKYFRLGGGYGAALIEGFGAPKGLLVGSADVVLMKEVFDSNGAPVGKKWRIHLRTDARGITAAGLTRDGIRGDLHLREGIRMGILNTLLGEGVSPEGLDAMVNGEVEKIALSLTSNEIRANQFLRELEFSYYVGDAQKSGSITITAGKFSPRYFVPNQPFHDRISSIGLRATFEKEINKHLFSVSVETFDDEIGALWFALGDDLAGYNIAYSKGLANNGGRINQTGIFNDQEVVVKLSKALPFGMENSYAVAIGRRQNGTSQYALFDYRKQFGKFQVASSVASEQIKSGNFQLQPGETKGHEYRYKVTISRMITPQVVAFSTFAGRDSQGTTNLQQRMLSAGGFYTFHRSKSGTSSASVGGQFFWEKNMKTKGVATFLNYGWGGAKTPTQNTQKPKQPPVTRKEYGNYEK
jgi:hypothetical protein